MIIMTMLVIMIMIMMIISEPVGGDAVKVKQFTKRAAWS